MSSCLSCPYWVTSRVGGCHLPCGEEIEKLVASSITALVSLVEEYELEECWRNYKELEDTLREKKILHYKLPTPDGGAPDLEEACKLIRELKEIEDRGGKIVFHCYGGQGRTGTMIIAYLVTTKNIDITSATSLLQKANPCAGPSSIEQYYFVEYISQLCSF